MITKVISLECIPVIKKLDFQPEYKSTTAEFFKKKHLSAVGVYRRSADTEEYLGQPWPTFHINYKGTLVLETVKNLVNGIYDPEGQYGHQDIPVLKESRILFKDPYASNSIGYYFFHRKLYYHDGRSVKCLADRLYSTTESYSPASDSLFVDNNTRKVVAIWRKAS